VLLAVLSEWAQGLAIKTTGMQGCLQLKAEHGPCSLKGVFQLRYLCF